jgi:shikimate kinase
MKKNVFLIGFMTSGKTTIGKILANTIGWNFVDLDQEIEILENKSITEIFKQNGEDYFRYLENKILKKFINEKNLVISLGGGAIENPENLQLILNNGIVIYLEISALEALKRLKFKRNRPIIFNNFNEEVSDEELIERINKIFERRVNIYNKAHIKLNTDKAKVGYTVDNIVNILKKDYEIP